ncbi:MAG TPA: hypothetical protein VFC12_06305 [Terriglobales bacterium]|nr:hypothetical protein [Terriglobales bacterium]
MAALKYYPQDDMGRQVDNPPHSAGASDKARHHCGGGDDDDMVICREIIRSMAGPLIG